MKRTSDTQLFACVVLLLLLNAHAQCYQAYLFSYPSCSGYPACGYSCSGSYCSTNNTVKACTGSCTCTLCARYYNLRVLQVSSGTCVLPSGAPPEGSASNKHLQIYVSLFFDFFGCVCVCLGKKGGGGSFYSITHGVPISLRIVAIKLRTHCYIRTMCSFFFFIEPCSLCLVRRLENARLLFAIPDDRAHVQLHRTLHARHYVRFRFPLV